MVFVEPGFEGTVVFLKLFDHFGIADGGVNFEPVADDAGILQEFLPFLIRIAGYFIDIEIIEGFKEIILLVEDGLPAQASLVDLQDQAGKKFVIVMERKAVFIIMIGPVNGVFAGVLDEVAIVGTHAANLEEIGRNKRLIVPEKEFKKFD